MSYQEKSAITSLIGNLIGCTLYFGEVFRRFVERDVSAGGDFAFWGAAILLFVPAIVSFKVIVQIIFSILNAISRGEQEPAVTDELDRLIALKALRNFCLLFMAGFLLSMSAAGATNQPTLMFVVLLFSVLAAGVMLDISTIYFYRRGV